MAKSQRRNKHKSLFSAGDDVKSNAMLNYMADHSWGYADGYFLAAEKLTEYVVVAQREQDLLIYPICFLYRQALELQLKLILTKAALTLGRDEDIELNHKLDRLWALAQKIICEAWPNEGTHELREIDYVISEFHRVDPTSQEFRYSKTTKAKRSLSEITHINLRVLSEKMAPVHNLLDGVIMAFDYELDCRADALNL